MAAFTPTAAKDEETYTVLSTLPLHKEGVFYISLRYMYDVNFPKKFVWQLWGRAVAKAIWADVM